MELQGEDYKKIVDELQSGMVCYIEKATGKIESVPKGIRDFDDFDEDDEGEDSWGKMLERFEDNIDDYYVLTPMDSSDAFKVMQRFARDEIKDEKFQMMVLRALERRGPFRNFKDLVEYNDDYRQPWFDYQEKYYRKYVKDCIHLADGGEWWDDDEEVE